MLNHTKKFIESHKDLIQDEDWMNLYIAARSDLPPTVIGDITKTLLSVGIDPLKDLKLIPYGYLSGVQDLTSFRIPDGILSIKPSAFDQCLNLREVTIPTSVVVIDRDAFYMCRNLKDIWYLGTQKQWIQIRRQSDCFAGTPMDIALHCTDGDLY